jgi:hypothetical protein
MLTLLWVAVTRRRHRPRSILQHQPGIHPEQSIMNDKKQKPPRTAPASVATPSSQPKGKNQGEGDYDAARRYREEVGEFLDHSDVEQIAKRAAPKSALEARELALAEERARDRSKGDDPADVGAMYPGRKADDKR